MNFEEKAKQVSRVENCDKIQEMQELLIEFGRKLDELSK